MISKKVSGYFGDPAGFEETLYQMPDGKYFLYVNGGEESPYKEENIKRMSAAKAKEFFHILAHPCMFLCIIAKI